MASSSTSVPTSDLNIVTGGLWQDYPYLSGFNVDSITPVKLSGKDIYDRWHDQMMNLIKTSGLLGFIDGTIKSPKENNVDAKNKAGETNVDAMYEEWKKWDTLVKKWILGSLSVDVISTVESLDTAKDVWEKLKTTYNVITPAKDVAEYLPIYRAIWSGDWEKAREVFNEDKNVFTARLTNDGLRALHLAIYTCQNTWFVKNILEEIDSNSLPTLVECNSKNPAHYAAIVGNTAALELLVDKNPHLLYTSDCNQHFPIHSAVKHHHSITSQYLFKISKQYIGLSQQDGYENPFEGMNGARLLSFVIDEGFLDLAEMLIMEYPVLARTNYVNIDLPILCIARKWDLYYSGTQYNIYQRFVYSYVPIEDKRLNMVTGIENQGTCRDKDVTKGRRSFLQAAIQRIYVKFWKMTLLHVSHIKQLKEKKDQHNTAVKLLKCISGEVLKLTRCDDMDEHFGYSTTQATIDDIPEVVEEILTCHPQAIWSGINNHYLIQLAIINRSEKVYSMILYKTNSNMFIYKVLKDNDGNNLLHLAGKLAPIHKLNVVSGAALQMQRELHWYQEVEKCVLPLYIEAKNNKLETPMMVFRREHEQLRKEGEEWMKKTAESYTITAALIITIVFAASITVPGGNSQDTGKAIYVSQIIFIIFAISDAISLFTSTTALLLFLSILTARYAEQDFLYRLPRGLIIGLVMLFLAVTSMIIAFSAALYIMFGQENEWILIPIGALACLPIASFVTLQFPLLLELISSTYGQGIFKK